MRWLSDALRQRNRGGQGGFALATVLAVLLLTSVLVAALLGLSFATTSFSGEQTRRDTETRAAESAITSSVARIARDEDATLGALVNANVEANACNWEPNTAAGETEADRPAFATVETGGETVQVTCRAEAPQNYVAETQITDKVQVSGAYNASETATELQGSGQPFLLPEQWWSTPASGECRSTPTSTPDPCLPWKEALDRADGAVPSTYNSSAYQAQVSPATRLGIIHSGTDPLRIIGDVTARHGTAVLRNDRECDDETQSQPCSFVPEGPGLTVSGSYAQGDPGLLSGPTGQECGILSPADRTAATDLRVPPAQIVAGKGQTCDNPTLRSLTPEDVPARLTWTPASIEASNRTLRAPQNAANGATIPWSATPNCLSGAIRAVRLFPGAYSKLQTANLNRWFNCSGTRTFHFTPGDYWFDADDGTNVAASNPAFSRRFSIVMSNPNSTYVFGSLAAGVSVTGITRDTPLPLCNPQAAGVSITLSARTTIQHEAGTVNMCGVPAGDNSPATIWQEDAPDLGSVQPATQVEGGLNLSNVGGFFGFINQVGQAVVNFFGGPSANYTSRITSTTPPFVVQAGGCWLGCIGGVQFAARFRNSSPNVVQADVNNAHLVVRGDSLRANGDNSSTRIDVYMPDRVGVQCSLTYPRIPEGRDSRGSLTIAYDLLSTRNTTPGSRDCTGVIRTRTDLVGNASREGATIVVNMFGESTTGVATYRVQVDSVDLVTGWRPTATSFSGCTSSWQRGPSLDIGSIFQAGRAGSCASSGSGSPTPTASLFASDDRRPGTGLPWVDAVTQNQGEVLRFRSGHYYGVRFQCEVRAPSWLGGFCIIWLPVLGRLTPVSGTGSVRLNNLQDWYDPDLTAVQTANAPLVRLGLTVGGRSRCDITDVGNFLLNPFGLFGASAPSGDVRGMGDCSYANDVTNDTPGQVQVRVLNSNNSEFCSAVFRRLPDWGETRYLDLLRGPGGDIAANNCNSRFAGQTQQALLGKSIELNLTFDRRNELFAASLFTGDRCADPFCEWWGYDLDHVGVLAVAGSTPNGSVTDAFAGPRAPLRVTSNDSPGQLQDARFNMFGPLVVPNNDLAVRWSGPANNYSLPVVTGYRDNDPDSAATAMVVRAIGSDTRRPAGVTEAPVTGILCCEQGKPAERRVILQARIGGELRAVAWVTVQDSIPFPSDGPIPSDAGTIRPGTDVVVRDLQLCNRNSVPPPGSDPWEEVCSIA